MKFSPVFLFFRRRPPEVLSVVTRPHNSHGARGVTRPAKALKIQLQAHEQGARAREFVIKIERV